MRLKLKKILYVILDGLGDLPTKKLGGVTPLEAADTPNMDKLASLGVSGSVFTVGKNIAPESDIAVISILGYDAHKYYTGRGPLESYAEGLDISKGDLAYRVNFATRGEGRDILDRRVGRNLSTGEAGILAGEINKKVSLDKYGATFEFKNTIGHRGVLVIRSPKGLSADVTNTDPAYDKVGVFGVAKEIFEDKFLECVPTKEAGGEEKAKRAAELTNEFVEKSSKVLDGAEVNIKRKASGKLPANLILIRDGGDSLPVFPDINKKYNLDFGCFVEMPVEKGIALLTGMKVVDLPLPTGIPEKDYPLRAERALKELSNFDVLYIHLKGPDEPAHDGDAAKKRDSISSIDKFFFGPLLKDVDLDNVVIAITADHSTVCDKKAHTDDPVPLIISGGGVKSDGTPVFSERASSSGSLGEMLGYQIMGKLVECISPPKNT